MPHKTIKAKPFPAFGILNAHGEFWTTEIFDSEGQAHEHISNWEIKYGMLPNHTVIQVLITPITKRKGKMKQYYYHIWSIEHNAWWKSHRRGCISDLSEAGLYTLEEALEIVKSANEGNPNIPNEAMVPVI